MKRTVLKYDIDAARLGKIVLETPALSDVLSVQIQRGRIVMWLYVHDDATVGLRHVAIVGTGRPLPESVSFRSYRGSVQEMDLFVWHVFVSEPDDVRQAAA